MWNEGSEEREDVTFTVEVATEDARCEHRFERFDDAKRYANGVQRLNPGVDVRLLFAAEGWLAEYRRDVWQEEGSE